MKMMPTSSFGDTQLVAFVVLTLAVPFNAHGGQILHVPMSWCGVQGSPAVANPNVTRRPPPNPGGEVDTTLDSVLWRRHERPTDGIYLPQANISFRSAINNAWTVVNYPTIPDTNTTQLLQGDILADANTVQNGNPVELNAAVNNCRTQWQMMDPTGMSQVYGITAVNARRFHDPMNNYVGTVGWATPRWMVLTDNSFLWPGHANRVFTSDPIDILSGHELGHALGLPHRNNTNALMNPTLTDNSGDGNLDNIQLNAAEITTLRNFAMATNGLEIDPPGVFDPGPVAAARRMDAIGDAQRRYLDIDSAIVALNNEQGTVTFETELAGLLPTFEQDLQYWMLIDQDDNPATGAGASLLRQQAGLITNFEGAELAIVTDVVWGEFEDRFVSGRAWQFQNDELVELFETFVSDLSEQMIHGLYAPGVTGPDLSFPFNHIVRTEVQNDQLLNPFETDTMSRMEVIVTSPNSDNPFDMLSLESEGQQFMIQHPSFPHAFVLDETGERVEGIGGPGDTLMVEVEGLLPDAPFHVLFGGVQDAFNGVTDADGNSLFGLTIPNDASLGPHLLTVGTDETALTADTTITVIPEPNSALSLLIALSVLFRFGHQKPK